MNTQAPNPQRLWVLMGNDYPVGVFDSEERANRYADQIRKAERDNARRSGQCGPGIYYRSYPFTLNAGDPT